MSFLLNQPILFILTILLAGLLFSFVMRSTTAEDVNVIKGIVLVASTAAFLIGVISVLTFDKSLGGFQFSSSWTRFETPNIALTLGVDGLSMVFLLLTLFTFPTLFLAAYSMDKMPQKYYSYFLFMEIALVLTFAVTDLFYFFVLFETLLIPMFLVIGIWGARERKIKAAYYFFLYTLAGSLCMLFGMFYLYFLTGSLSYYELAQSSLEVEEQEIIWLCFFLAFAVKTPLFPFHLWLPEAHVEAPTVGSMLLASLLLKLGSYGFLRFSLTYLSEGTIKFGPAVLVLASLGVLYGSLATVRQIDLKRIVAYSSVAHMNLGVLGIFSFSRQGIDGSIFLSVAHGVVSSALFLCVGVIYDRYHTRLVRYYSGLVAVMPLFAAFFFYFSLANTAFPGTPNFIGELLTLNGVFQSNPGTTLLGATGIVFSAVYALWTYNRVCFGTLKTQYIEQFKEMNRAELFTLATLLVAALFLGASSTATLAFTEKFVEEIVVTSMITVFSIKKLKSRCLCFKN